MEYTKGEWEVGEGNDVYSGGACVARVCGAPEGIEESIANANLIAASPRLHKALKDMLSQWQSWGLPCDSPTDEEIIDNAQQALAQVEGR